MQQDYYSNLYDKDYFLGKKSFFYKFGYKDFIKTWNSRLNILLGHKKSGKLLDVGCALGYMLVPFSKHFEVYGIDCSKYAIGKAKKIVENGIFKVHNAEESFPFMNNTFDVVTCFDVLEHIEDVDSLIENIYNVLKKKGILFLITPNYNILRKTLIYFPDKMEHHISLYHVDEILKKLIKHNFKIINHLTEMTLFGKSFLFKSNVAPETFVIAEKV